MGTANHHAMQCCRVLWNIDQDGTHFKYCGVIGLQPSLGTVESLRLSNVALHHRSTKYTQTHTYIEMRLHNYTFLDLDFSQQGHHEWNVKTNKWQMALVQFVRSVCQ